MSHQTGAGHPECAERLSVTMEHLATLPLQEKLKHYEPLSVEQELIEANHSSAYLTRARQTCAGGSTFLDSLDVTVSEESYDIALKAAGATLSLAEGVINRGNHPTALPWCARPVTMPKMTRPWGSAS